MRKRADIPRPKKVTDMGHLGESKQITTVNDEEVIFTTAEGQPLRMNKAALAEVIRQAMPVATTDKNGLMSAGFAEKSYSVPSGDSMILDSGTYIIKASYYSRIAILMVSNLKSIYLAKDDFFDAYTTLEVIEKSKCKLTNRYTQVVSYSVTRIAL